MNPTSFQKINPLLTNQLGFAPRELDFTLNCDIKYSSGRDKEEEE
jgi:hypothetical protein